MQDLKEKSKTRDLPHNEDAERCLLGCVMVNQGKDSVAEEILTTVQLSDFYTATHVEIFDAMRVLHKNGMAVDYVTVSEVLEGRGKMQEVGGMTYLTTLATMLPSGIGYREYLSIVQNNAQRRRLIGVCQETAEQAWEQQKPAAALLSDAESQINALTMTAQGPELVHIAAIDEAERERMERAMRGEHNSFGLTTGFKEFDRALWGLQKSDLLILAARPAAGKTAFALNILRHAALQSKKVCAFFSLEQDGPQIIRRLYSIHTGIDHRTILSGEGLHEHMDKISSASVLMRSGNLQMSCQPYQSVAEMLLQSKRIQRAKGLDLVVVDYLQIARPEDQKANRTAQIGQIARDLKHMARRLNVPVIALSQLNRDFDKDASAQKEPTLAHLRDSGEIEQEADIVAFLYTKDKADVPIKNITLKLGKFRSGQVRSFGFTFEGKNFRFRESSLLVETQEEKPKLKQSELVPLSETEAGALRF